MLFVTILVGHGALYEVITASKCIIFNDQSSCHKSCHTCASNSYCGNPNACRSCHSGEYKISSNFDDEIFACSKTCEHFSFKLNDYFFCDISATKGRQTSTVENFTVQNFYKNNKSEGYTYEKFALFGGIGAVSCIGVGVCYFAFYKTRNKIPPKPNAVDDLELGIVNANEIVTIRNKQKSQKSNFNNLKLIQNVNEFEKNDLLGGGNFSRVYEGKLNGELVAIKIALKEGRKSIHKELQIYDKVAHPNILQAFGVHFGIENMLFLALRKFNLKDYFIDYGNDLGFCQLKQYCIQIADGMRYLHKQNILHCDLKIDNILIKDDKGEQVEISDFGCAIDLDHDHETQILGTPTHTAYELLKKSINPNYAAIPSKASDVWSFAVTVWQIFQKFDKLPIDFLTPKDIIANHENGKKLPTPLITSERFWRQIVIRCFDLDPLARPSMNNLYQSLLKFKEETIYINVTNV